MHSSSFASALVAVLPLVSAMPSKLAQRDTCGPTGEFPWFVTAQNSLTCTDNPPVYPAAESGPPPGSNQICQPLDPQGVASYAAAAVNLACTDFPYTFTLYTTADCSDAQPVSVTTPSAGAQCLVAPAGTPFLRYSAVAVVPPARQ